jgi:hypothetical protein
MTALQNQPFEIISCVVALPLRFGMTVEDSHSLLGAPQNISTIWDKTGFSHSWDVPNLNIGFSNENALKHVGFVPGGCSGSLNGTCIWTRESYVDPNPILLRFDPNPRECYGVLVYLEIGITTTGFHDDDPSERSLCIFTSGAYDDLRPKSPALDLSRCGYLHSRNGG